MMKLPYSFIALFSLCLLLMSSSSHAAKLYKWVDADGNISYQDTPPPANAKLLKESTIQGSIPATTGTAGTPVTVYTVENCATCDQLTDRLRELNVPFNEQSLMDRDIQTEIISASDSLTAPTLKIGSQYYSDMSDIDLLVELRVAGYKLKPRQASNAPSNGAPRVSNEP